jgi:hypothetical protein
MKTLQDEIRKNGAMDILYSDGASAQVGQKAKEIMRSFVIDDWASEPHNPNQNFAERAWRDTKRNVNATMNMTGAPANTWLLALKYVLPHFVSDFFMDFKRAHKGGKACFLV